MTQRQENHLEKLKMALVNELDAKYRAGAKEHPGFIGDLSLVTLIAEAKKEALDQFVYLDTLFDLTIALIDENESLKDRLNNPNTVFVTAEESL